jgi:hypothetical protein
MERMTKLHAELVGHTNHKQKIKLHLKIKVHTTHKSVLKQMNSLQNIIHTVAFSVFDTFTFALP